MNQSKENRITMFKSVDAYLRLEGVWSTLNALAAVVQIFRDHLGELDLIATAESTQSGASNRKADMRDKLEDLLYLISEALGVMAHTSGNHDLQALTSMSRSDLSSLGAEQLSNRAEVLAEQAGGNLTALAPMNINQAFIDKVVTAANDFRDAKDEPRATAARRTKNAEALASKIREINDLLRNQMDRLVNLCLPTNPEFVAGYRAARVIFDRPATHAKKTPPTTPE
jgi:hypothetical protein